MALETRSLRFTRIMLFAGIFAAMQFGWNRARGTNLERVAIDDLTVRPAAWLINHITPEIMVQAVGTRLNATGGGINILNGCEGSEVVFLFAAAMMVAQFRMKWRLVGMLIGSIAILGCNQVRILALFYVNRSDKVLFELLHGIVAPIALILIATFFFIFWLDRFSTRPEAQDS
jgi:exosortase/archaeosortase family protein